MTVHLHLKKLRPCLEKPMCPASNDGCRASQTGTLKPSLVCGEFS